MATKSTPKRSGGEPPAAEQAAPKPAAPAKGAIPNGRKDSAKTGALPKPDPARRSGKGTTVNAETAKVLRDADAGKGLLDYPSLEAMFEDLGI